MGKKAKALGKIAQKLRRRKLSFGEKKRLLFREFARKEDIRSTIKRMEEYAERYSKLNASVVREPTEWISTEIAKSVP
jgi:DNA-directed RNA polymerase subunit F